MFEKERGGEMLSLLIVILVMVVLFKVTGFMFHIAGKLLGGIFGIIGWLILGGLAISVFVFPIILIVGIVALAVAAAR